MYIYQYTCRYNTNVYYTISVFHQGQILRVVDSTTLWGKHCNLTCSSGGSGDGSVTLNTCTVSVLLEVIRYVLSPLNDKLLI